MRPVLNSHRTRETAAWRRRSRPRVDPSGTISGTLPIRAATTRILRAAVRCAKVPSDIPGSVSGRIVPAGTTTGQQTWAEELPAEVVQ